MPPNPLILDFSSPQRPLRQPYRALGAGLLVAGVLTLLAALQDYQTELGDTAALAARVERLRSRQAQVVPANAISPILRAALKQAGLANAQLAVPWDRLFRAIEESRGDDIALLSLALDPARGDIGLAGEARDLPALSAFAQALSEHGEFADVTLSQHKLSDGVPPVIVRFELRLVWRAPAAEAGS